MATCRVVGGAPLRGRAASHPYKVDGSAPVRVGAAHAYAGLSAAARVLQAGGARAACRRSGGAVLPCGADEGCSGHARGAASDGRRRRAEQHDFGSAMLTSGVVARRCGRPSPFFSFFFFFAVHPSTMQSSSTLSCNLPISLAGDFKSANGRLEQICTVENNL